MRAPVFPPPSAPREKKRRRSWLLSFLGFGFAASVVLFLLGATGAGYLLWKASKDLPDYESLAKYEPPVMTRIHTHDGSLISEYARERRIYVPINTIPKQVIAAFLSAEDRRFYEHGGLDFQGIGRAVYKIVEAKMKGADRRAEGASTITQQVAKNFLLTSDRTVERKIKEAILAIRIERALQGQDPRALPQRDLPRHRLLRRGRRQPQLFQQGAEGPHHRGGGLSRRAAQGAQQPPVPPHQAGHRAPQLDHRPDAGERVRHPGPGRGRAQAAAGQHPAERRAHLRRRVLRRGGAPRAARPVRRGQALRRRALRAHDSGPQAAVDRAPR